MSNEQCPPPPIGDGSQEDIPAAGASSGPSTGNYIQFHNLQDLQPLCELGVTPSIVTALIMRTLANHFSDSRLIMEPTLKKYVWNEDPTKSKIRIVPNTVFDPVQSGMMPALVVKRRPQTSSRKVMGDFLGPRDQRDSDTGADQYVRFMSGGHRIFAIAETDGEAELLAMEVLDLMTFLGPALTRLPYFLNFETVGVGELGALDGLGNKIGVPIDVTYIYEYAWALEPLAPRLKTLNINIS